MLTPSTHMSGFVCSVRGTGHRAHSPASGLSRGERMSQGDHREFQGHGQERPETTVLLEAWAPSAAPLLIL